MKLPEIPVTDDQITMINTFLGVNLSQSVQDAQFSELENLNNDSYPVLGTRSRRAYLSKIKLTKPLALLGGEHIGYVDEIVEDSTVKDVLYYNETRLCDLLSKGKELGAVEDRTKYQGKNRKLILMGAYLCVFPDGIIFNTTYAPSEDEAWSSVVNKTTATGASFTACTYSGTDISITSSGETAPALPEGETEWLDGTYWFDTSNGSGVLKRYSRTLSAWQSVGTAYVKISATGIGKGFKAYDAVTFSGVEDGGATYNDYDFNGSSVVFKTADDYLIVAGYINKTFTSDVTAERKLPDLEYITEMDNRLWGCNSAAHEIYASKLGDPTNWYCYAGLESDSYTVTTGEHGNFTGACTFNDTVIIFMEHGMYRVYGTKPSNYEVSWKPCRGVQYGSGNSICQIGDYLYYKARDGVVVFDGSAELVSNDLGTENYYEAIASNYKSKYYCFMRDKNYKYRMYVYDTDKNTWVIEGAERIWFMTHAEYGLCFIDDSYSICVASSSEIYSKWFPGEDRNNFPTSGNTVAYYPVNSVNDSTDYVPATWHFEDQTTEDSDGTTTKRVKVIDTYYDYTYASTYAEYAKDTANNALYPGDSVSCDLEDIVEWTATTGDIGLDTPYRHYLKRLDLRLWLDCDAEIKVEVAYDRSDRYEYLMTYKCTRKRTISIPVRIRRCDSLRLRISGHGDMKLYSIAKIVEDGSDL